MENTTNTSKQRTNRQNRALHKFCTELAVELNNAGVSMDVFFKNVEAEHTMESVKNLWRGFAKAKYQKNGTHELESAEITEIYDEVNRHVAKWGIHLEFPSEENTDNYLQSYDTTR